MDLIYSSQSTRYTSHWLKEPNELAPFCAHNAASASPLIIFPVQLADDSTLWIGVKILHDLVAHDIDKIFEEMHPERVMVDHRVSISRFLVSLGAEITRQIPSHSKRTRRILSEVSHCLNLLYSHLNYRRCLRPSEIFRAAEETLENRRSFEFWYQCSRSQHLESALSMTTLPVRSLT